MVSHGGIYQHAALYDLAFSYRDFARESECLRELYAQRRGRAPRSFLELAAGPASHSIEMLAAGLEVLALDLSPEMASHARRKAAERNLVLSYTVADMTELPPLGRFDLVACLLCSASYLLTDQAVLSHLVGVRGSLSNDGMYVLELTHPSEMLGTKKSANTWRMRDQTGELEIEWGGSPAAAIDRIWHSEVKLVYRPFDGSAPISAEDEGRHRGFTHAEIVDFAQQSGFVVEATLGAFDDKVAFDSPEATRMIVVLKKT